MTSVRRTRTDPRRERTPRRLVAAARVVFARDGFYRARLSDITDEAGLAAGTLYNYYRSKSELFRDVIREVADELAALPDGHVSSQHDPVRRVEEVNRVYLHAVQRNARLMSLLYQVATEDDEVRALGDGIARQFHDRAVAAIENWQRAGLAYPDLDPLHTAHALTFMVERVAMACAQGRVDYDVDIMIDTVNRIWVRALGLAPLAPSATPAGSPAGDLTDRRPVARTST